MKRPMLIVIFFCILAPAIYLLGQTNPATGPSQPATTTSKPTPMPKDWKLYTAGTAFTFSGPADLKEEKLQGVDSFVGKYASPTMTITFDYGWYSNPLDDPKYKRTPITVDGREAFLVTWEGGAGLYVPVVGPTKGLANSPVKLQMSIACGKDVLEQAALLLRSIKFIEPVAPR